MNLRIRAGITLAVLLGAFACASEARAQSTIRDPNPPKYSVEIEPKLNIDSNVYAYGGTGFGPGVRFSIPVMSPGFVKTINDSIAISFGLDLVHYSGYGYGGYYCDRNGNCSNAYTGPDFWATYFPVTMQWNFWFSEKWSAFGEPGLVIRHGFWNDGYCYNNHYCSNTDVLPAFYVGGRFKVSDSVGLTMRLGYPTFFSFGVSIFI
jgi:hypothetical protein